MLHNSIFKSSTNSLTESIFAVTAISLLTCSTFTLPVTTGASILNVSEIVHPLCVAVTMYCLADKSVIDNLDLYVQAAFSFFMPSNVHVVFCMAFLTVKIAEPVPAMVVAFVIVSLLNANVLSLIFISFHINVFSTETAFIRYLSPFNFENEQVFSVFLSSAAVVINVSKVSVSPFILYRLILSLLLCGL
ncbi:MAG: hypothetical protein J6X32_05190 [Salinivirgaceae bacterium]|nr:hypothetical protein [Salinivirgaceae bacterium]